MNSSDSSVVRALQSIELLANLSAPMLESIASFSKIRDIRVGETIFCQGEPSPYCFGVVSGQISIQRVSKDRQLAPKVLSLLGAGSVFGESALFEDSPRMAMASAAQSGQLVAILGSKWREWIHHSEGKSVPLLMGLLRSTMSRLSETSQDLAVTYGVGQILLGSGSLAELSSALAFLHGSLSAIDHWVLFQRSESGNEYQPLVQIPGGTASSVLTLPSSWVKEFSAPSPVIVGSDLSLPWESPAKLVLPLFDAQDEEKSPCGLLLLTSRQDKLVFTPSLLLLLTAVGYKLGGSLSRHRSLRQPLSQPTNS